MGNPGLDVVLGDKGSAVEREWYDHLIAAGLESSGHGTREEPLASGPLPNNHGGAASVIGILVGRAGQ